MNRPVLLGLSSYRRRQEQIQRALALSSQEGRRLVVVFVVDINLARYFAGSDVVAGTSLRELMEQGILEEHKAEAQRILQQVMAQAQSAGVSCEADLRVGRFGEEIKRAAAQYDPEVIVVTRARRPAWLRRLFGSPVDQLCRDLSEHCRVEVV